jgi:hypothetical protein
VDEREALERAFSPKALNRGMRHSNRKLLRTLPRKVRVRLWWNRQVTTLSIAAADVELYRLSDLVWRLHREHRKATGPRG